MKISNNLGIYSIRATPVFPILRVGTVESEKPDVVISGVLADGPELEKIVREYFYRSVCFSNQIQIGRTEIEKTLKLAGATAIWTDRLPASTSALWSGDAVIRRGAMTAAVRSICTCLSRYRILWRSMGQVAVLEKPIGAPAWLRPLDISEIEMMIDALGVVGDDTAGEAGYIMNRVAHAVTAALPSWLPPAGVVEIATGDQAAGYDANSETIFLPSR